MKPLYPWQKWLKGKPTTIKKGKDYDCQTHSMIAQIRSAASRLRLRVGVSVEQDAITIIPRRDPRIQRPKKKLEKKQRLILKFLQEAGDWVTRSEMEEACGKKGFSKALGAPTGPKGIKPGTLEHLRYVNRRDRTPPFEYRITKSGATALCEWERENGPVEFL